MNLRSEEVVASQISPLSKNAFVAFFQKMWRAWLAVWYGFCDKHPKLAPIIYQVFFFVVFSEGVTIVQILILIFLPQMLGLELATKEFMFPKVPIKIGEFEYNWSFLGNEVLMKDGVAIIGGGLGYFIAFKVATFIAQVINFPLQRNITYRSHGNPWYQAMWYFIGWVVINLACDAINNLWLPIVNHFVPPAISAIIAMVAQGGIAMVVFFFIFMVIFPDNNKAAANAKTAYDKLVAENAPAEKIEEAKAKLEKAELAALLTNTEKAEIAAVSQASAKAIKYFSLKNGKNAVSEDALKKALEEASVAVDVKEQAQAERAAALAKANA